MTRPVGYWQEGGHEEQPGRLGELRRVQALGIERHGQARPSPRLDRQPEAQVAGVLHGHAPGRGLGEAEHQIEGLLAAGEQQDLVGLAPHGARGGEVAGQRRTELGEAARIPVPEEPGSAPAVPAQQPAPQRAQRLGDPGQPRSQGQPLGQRPVGQQGTEDGRGPGSPEGALRSRLGRTLPLDLGPHVGAAAVAGLGIAFRAEPLQGGLRGVPRDLQMRGQGPAGGEPATRRQGSSEDGLAQSCVDLGLERRLRLPRKGHQGEADVVRTARHGPSGSGSIV